MLTSFQRIFSAPTFPEDEDKTQKASYLNVILPATTGLLIVLSIARIVQGETFFDPTNYIIYGLAGALSVFYVILHLKYVQTASFLFVLTSWAGLMYLSYIGDGVRDSAFFGSMLSLLMAGLLLDYRYSIAFAVANIVVGQFIATTVERTTLSSATGYVRDVTVVFILAVILSYFTINGLRSALDRSRKNAKKLEESYAELNGLRRGLEQRVDERTSDLAAANRQMTRRAAQLQAVSDVAHAIASIQDIDALLPEITKAISRSFNVYHVGIFLVDEEKRYAVLSAANSEGGQRMLSRAHKLEIGRTGIVGDVAASGQPRVALDTGADATYFNNPDLPETHSEMALPLKIGTEIIGVLDVQSTNTNAFTSEDVDVLSTLSNQVAIAIQNARLFSQTRVALAEAEGAFQRYVAAGWQAYTGNLAKTGFTLKEKRLSPLEGDFAPTANKEAMTTGRIAVEQSSHQPVLAIPIRVRGTTIGVMNVRAGANDRTWNTDELTTAQTIAERVAIALENARLVEETRERAGRERAIAEMSNRIGASIDMDNILTTAVRELGRLVPDSDVVIQLGRPAEE